MPRSFAFTGTPIAQKDKDTRAVFGDYVDIYDIEQAVKDGATVPIYYESRLVKLEMDPEASETIDDEVDELTEDEEESARSKIKKPVGSSAGEAGCYGAAHRHGSAGPCGALRDAGRLHDRQGNGGVHEPRGVRAAVMTR